MQNYKIGSGLENLGNTCFFNAVIQSILYTEPLAIQLQAKSHSKKCEKNDWCVFCQLQQIWYHTRNSKVYAPTNMIKNLKSIFKKFKLGRQEDSHQLLRYLIEGMQTVEVGKPLKDRKENQEKIKKCTTFNIFGGEMRTCVHCSNCNFRSLTDQRYYDMNIECQKSSSLQEGLQKFFEVDKLSGSNKYNCERCKKLSQARKRFYILSAPQIMTFQFKRFTNSLRKIGKFIKFPKKINLSAFFEEKRKVIMELYAVIVHAGGTSWSGHYYAFVKVNQCWYRMDDMRVSKCSQESVLSQNVYLVFYKKIVDEKIENQEQSKQKKEQHQAQQCTITIKSREVNNNSNIKTKSQQIKQNKVLENGIKVDGLLQGILYKKKPQEFPKQNQESVLENEIQIPNQLIKTRSKQQANRETPLAQMILKYAQSLMSLSMKLQRPRHRSLDRLRSLRKYELAMKRRKMG